MKERDPPLGWSAAVTRFVSVACELATRVKDFDMDLLVARRALLVQTLATVKANQALEVHWWVTLLANAQIMSDLSFPNHK